VNRHLVRAPVVGGVFGHANFDRRGVPYIRESEQV